MELVIMGGPLAKTKKAKLLPGMKLHAWILGPKQANGLFKYRCGYCDFIAFAKYPFTPDGDPNNPCKVSHN